MEQLGGSKPQALSPRSSCKHEAHAKALFGKKGTDFDFQGNHYQQNKAAFLGFRV